MSLSKAANPAKRDIEFLHVTPAPFTYEWSLEMVEKALSEYFGNKQGTVGYHFMTKDDNGKSPFNKTIVVLYTVNNHADLRVVMINSYNDIFLHKQAKAWNMPRGFPGVINIRTGEISPSGFFGKFMNDKGQTESFPDENKEPKLQQLASCQLVTRLLCIRQMRNVCKFPNTKKTMSTLTRPG
jgi:hypothetical protein